MPASAAAARDGGGPPPSILVLDAALQPAAFERCRQAIDRLAPRLVDKQALDGKIAYRRYQDYEAPEPTLTEELGACLFSEPVLSVANRYHDLAWRWLAAGVSREMDLQVTSYSHGSQYLWHTDHLVRGRTHNFILYMTDPGHFAGGELQISCDEPRYSAQDAERVRCDFSIRPARNRLVLMPSHLLHRVTPVTCASATPELWQTRLTINGHLRVPGMETLGRTRAA
ncbi:MAG TPA: 2OG-Fe(II) oxygenase [Polyangiaceae bacterium]|jgi:Rps23 Pro-64 3,4-dihydroxylase Tpa1-like proline 4-hydroxylase|nr:2OG-Fe(II) oxygenase [Polyangiaceae bacterium]